MYHPLVAYAVILMRLDLEREQQHRSPTVTSRARVRAARRRADRDLA